MIEMKDIKKTYRTGAVSFDALRGIDLDVDNNEFIAIAGPSGSGKSTLMNLVGCLDTATDGEYMLEGKQVNSLSLNQLAEIRNRKVGFVFQAFNLLPYATSYENIELPMIYAGLRGKERKRRVTDLLARVGLADKGGNRPTELSGGEMQRVAIARALANNPTMILADEPTGNLDTKSGAGIIQIFEELWQAGHTVIVITHDVNIAERCQRLIRLKDGLIESDNGNNGNGSAGM